MNHFVAFFTLAGALFFSACSSTTAFDFFTTDVYYEKAVTNMKKASLMRDAETKAILHAVYLNNVDPELYYDDAYFYVALHIMHDSPDPASRGLFNPDYAIKILSDEPKDPDDPEKQPEYDASAQHEELFEAEEGTNDETAFYAEPLQITVLDENHKLRRTMPVRSRWNHFYLVRFKQSEKPTIDLLFESDQFGKAGLTFQKEM